MPREGFAAGGLHRFWFGTTYRVLWTRPIEVGRLDLGAVGGGLKLIPRDNPGRPFLIEAADGRTFGFRELVKDATLDWDRKIRSPVARKLAQDQISGTIPGGALAARVLERAAGLTAAPSQLVVLPDDERLGPWRKDFAGRIGLLEERMDSTSLRTVPGALELIDTEELFKRLRSDPANEVDASAFLAARLVDFLIGDWDRYDGQWSWAGFRSGAGRRWAPIPLDRDWAFVRLDGFFWGAFRKVQPKFGKYSGRFSSLKGLTLRAEPLDRRLLVKLDRRTWDSVVSAVASRIDDRTIAAAVAALPPGFDDSTLRWLTQALRQRRDSLPGFAAAYYRALAEVVELWGSDAADAITLQQEAEGAVTVTLPRGARAWSRRFVPGETKEIRIHTFGGADRVSGTGAPGPIRVIVADAGGGALDVAGSLAGIAVYDSSARFEPPVDPYSPAEMTRDWGGKRSFSPWIDYKAGMGLVIGGGPTLTRYGFRRVPYASRIGLRVAYVTGFTGVNADLKADVRFADPRVRWFVRVDALMSDRMHFFGLGNETERTEAEDFYLLRRSLFRAEPRFGVRLGPGELSFGGTLRHSNIDNDRQTLALAQQPYGFEPFTELGAVAGYELDATDDPGYPTFGAKLRLDGRWFPALGDVQASFGVAEAEAAGYLTAGFLPASPTLALRGGGAKAWGDPPFFEAPTLGGRRSARGYESQRFTGDASLFGSAELRLNFGGLRLLPAEWGIYGLGDIGRVYLDGETSDRWHQSWGVGIWLGLGGKSNAVSFTYADGKERRRLYFYGGFHF